jgi:hypothetical protein
MNLNLRPIVASMLSAGLLLGAPFASAGPTTEQSTAPVLLAQNPCAAKKNPCAAKANPCAAKKNPCAAKNPCAGNNPCAAGGVDPKLVTRPKGSKPYSAKNAELVATGEQMWNDKKLSTNGLSCGTCHTGNAAFNASFAKPYPHLVAMAQDQSKLKRITMEQMVQFCMVVPMAAKPLAWDSKELAALTAYTGVVQKGFIKTGAKNPCAGKNPCATKNPCGAKANPCAAKKNPCAAGNPCAAKKK